MTFRRPTIDFRKCSGLLGGAGLGREQLVDEARRIYRQAPCDIIQRHRAGKITEESMGIVLIDRSRTIRKLRCLRVHQFLRQGAADGDGRRHFLALRTALQPAGQRCTDPLVIRITRQPTAQVAARPVAASPGDALRNDK